MTKETPNMNDIRKKTPTRYRRTTNKYVELVDAAIAERGEWFSAPNESSSLSNAHSLLYRQVGHKFAEVTIRGDEVFLRILA